MSGPQNRGRVETYEEGTRDAGWAGLRLAALCIGVGAYSELSKLGNPVRDAEALFQAINKCPNCRAAIVRDPEDKMTIINHLKDDFLKKLADLPPDKLPRVVLLVLGGHGMQHDSNVFLIPTKSKCNDKTDLEERCLSHMTVLKFMLDYLDWHARRALKEVKFVLILDMCRNPGAFDRTNTISEPDQDNAPECWCICYSTSRGSLAADGGPCSNSPLVLGLVNPESGIFAPGVSLELGIKNACESVQNLSGVNMRQRPIQVNIGYLGNVILQERPQEVSEGAGTPTSEYEIVAYLKRRGLHRIAECVSTELGLEEIDDLQYVKTEDLNKLEWLAVAQKEKLLRLCREVTARLMSAADTSTDTTSQEVSSPLARSVGNPNADVFGIARNGGDCKLFREHMQSFIKSWRWYLETDSAQESYVLGDSLSTSWTACMFLWIRFGHDATLDQRLCDEWRNATTNSPNQDKLLSILTECLLHSGTTHPLWSPAKGSACRKEHAAAISFTDEMVKDALRGNENAKQKWRENVVRGWFDKTDEPASAFLSRANKFLSDPEHSIQGMSIFESVVKTQSYVVFIKMTGLTASLLFGYLEARKLDFASATGAAGGGRTLLNGFASFVSSEGHAFSLSKTGVPASHVIVEGLQGMVHLAHTCWEMMGPVKTAEAFLLSAEDGNSAYTPPAVSASASSLGRGQGGEAKIEMQMRMFERHCKWRGWVKSEIINRKINSTEIPNGLKYFAIFPNSYINGWQLFELHTGKAGMTDSQVARLLGHDLQIHKDWLQLMPLRRGDKFSDKTNATWVFGDPCYNLDSFIDSFLSNRGVVSEEEIEEEVASESCLHPENHEETEGGGERRGHALEGGTDSDGGTRRVHPRALQGGRIRGLGEAVQGGGVEGGGHALGGEEDEEITIADVELLPRPPLTKPLAAGLYVCADTVSQVRERGDVPRAASVQRGMFAMFQGGSGGASEGKLTDSRDKIRCHHFVLGCFSCICLRMLEQVHNKPQRAADRAVDYGVAAPNDQMEVPIQWIMDNSVELIADEQMTAPIQTWIRGSQNQNGQCRCRGTSTRHAVVTSVLKIENGKLRAQYNLAKKILKTKLAAHGSAVDKLAHKTKLPDDPVFPKLDEEINELFLFHGTETEGKGLTIAKQGFDERVANLHGLYGADTRHCDSNVPTRRPPAKANGRLYDSIFAQSGVANHGAQQHNEYIVFRGDQVYPEFLVTFTVS